MGWGIKTNHFKEKNYEEQRGIWGEFLEHTNPLTYKKEIVRNSCPYFFGIKVKEDSLSHKKTYQFNRIGEGVKTTLNLILINETILVFEGIEYFRNGTKSQVRETYFLRKEK